MNLKDRAEAISNQRYTSLVLKNIKDFFSELFDKHFSKTLKVSVDNLNTKLEKEVAENTRGVKGRLDQLIKKNVDLSSIESKLDEIASKEYKVDSVSVGEVSVSNFPEPQKEIRISNLDEIVIPKQKSIQKYDFSNQEESLSRVERALNSIYEYLPILKPQEFPKITIPRKVSIKEAENIIESIESMAKTLSDDLLALSKVVKAQEVGGGMNESGKVEVEVTNFPPQHIPTPVTNININSLRGVPLSTLVTVGTQPTPLPATPITQRRSLLIFNDSGETLYIGGANVTTSNGLPVLDQSYSPPIDAGEYMKIYGIMASGGDVRVFEVSSDSEGN